jgi:hypothetical protein
VESVIVQVGVDLGKRRDPTALVVAELQQEDGAWHYYVRHIERLDLGTPYDAVVARLIKLDEGLWRRGCTPTWYVDATGLGTPVIDALRQTDVKGRLVPVYLTASDHPTWRAGELRLGKPPMASRLAVLMEQGRLHLPHPDTSEDAAALRSELERFGRETVTGGVRFEAATGHDDLVIALALACWEEPRPEVSRAVPGWAPRRPVRYNRNGLPPPRSYRMMGSTECIGQRIASLLDPEGLARGDYEHEQNGGR